MPVGEAQEGLEGAEQVVQEEANALEAVPVNPSSTNLGFFDETGLPENVEFSDEEVPDYKPADEDEELLFGPPTGAVPGGVGYQQLDAPLPASLVRRLPALARAAAEPGAPASLTALYRLTIDKLEREVRGG